MCMITQNRTKLFYSHPFWNIAPRRFAKTGLVKKLWLRWLELESENSNNKRKIANPIVLYVNFTFSSSQRVDMDFLIFSSWEKKGGCLKQSLLLWRMSAHKLEFSGALDCPGMRHKSSNRVFWNFWCMPKFSHISNNPWNHKTSKKEKRINMVRLVLVVFKPCDI